MLDLRYASGLGRACDLQDNKRSTSIVSMPRVLEKGVSLIAGSVGKVPKATITRLNLVHASGPYRLFILV
ncbi:Hypothetical predicted protein [Prunus dulcis]|uniref:Uncharacterized protein n=1 Tax=Prunus dulcis TaxID=3755 RepID=A0A5E4GM02_PRUDU|nr:hypothetical protein L3X38_037138 [Prunus dulcis]VVA40760.1 Hypothetical predicted protein [Prunus dulcis]